MRRWGFGIRVMTSLMLVIVPCAALQLFAADTRNGARPGEAADAVLRRPVVVVAPERAATVSEILARNMAVWLVIGLGLITGGLLAVVGLAGLGMQLGLLLAVLQVSDVTLITALAALAVHGIPELASFVLIGSVGLAGPVVLIMTAHGKWDELGAERRRTSRTALISAMLLVLAAVTEVYLTPALIRMSMR